MSYGKELNAGLASPESNVLPPVLLHLSRPTDRLVGTPAWPSSVVGYVSQRAAGPVTTPGGRGTPGMARGSCEAAVADRRGAARCNPGSAGLGRRRVKYQGTKMTLLKGDDALAVWDISSASPTGTVVARTTI